MPHPMLPRKPLPHAATVLCAGVCLVSPSAPGADAGLTQANLWTSEPRAGLINDWLHAQSPAAQPWDVGGQFRVRYEVKDNAGSFPNNDFLRGLENSNDYFLFRTKAHLGYAPVTWFAAFAEGRDSHAVSDARPVTETDAFDLYQAFVRLGDAKQFPLSLKVGR